MSFPSLRHHTKRTFTTTCKALDHYRTLGLKPDATKAQIKSHYYQLSRIHHPDVSSDPKSREVFAKISEAYAVLINERDRRAYDRTFQQEHRRAANRPGFATHPRPPPKREARATYAWEHSRRWRPGYDIHPQGGGDDNDAPHRRAASARPVDALGRMNRAERRAEEAVREMERVRGVSGVMRALQLIGLMGLSIAIFGGWRRI